MSADVGRFGNKGVEVSNLNSLATPPGDMGGVRRDMAGTGISGGRLGLDNGLLGLARYMNNSGSRATCVEMGILGQTLDTASEVISVSPNLPTHPLPLCPHPHTRVRSHHVISDSRGSSRSDS
jgi:hypothetical protein